MEEYIASFEEPVKKRLEQIRSIIRKAAPRATESISYNMPAYKLNKPLAYFAAFNNHIGFYPTPSGIKAMGKAVEGYVNAKGSIQFPHDKPLPVALIKKAVMMRKKELVDSE